MNGDTVRMSSHNLLHLNMIFALASIESFRAKQSHKHPFGYFMAGWQHVADTLTFRSIEDIQGFLLLVGFGQYYYTGCSIWELCQICMRMSIELGLHKPSRTPLSLRQEQTRRRVFWECYQLDRTTSFTTGRPYGIEDSDVGIEEPIDIRDEDLDRFKAFDAVVPSGAVTTPTELTVFNATLKLVRIGSQIRSTFYSRILSNERYRSGIPVEWANHETNTGLDAGDTYHLFEQYDSKLRAWKDSIPIIQDQNSVFHRNDWFDLLYAQERFCLVRAAIDCVQSRHSLPPEGLLKHCYDAAETVIWLYAQIKSVTPMVCSWHYLQQVLSCGLCIVFCCLIELDPRTRDRRKRRNAPAFGHSVGNVMSSSTTTVLDRSPIAVVDACANILSWISEHMADAKKFFHFYDAMRRELRHAIHHASRSRDQSRRTSGEIRDVDVEQSNVVISQTGESGTDNVTSETRTRQEHEGVSSDSNPYHPSMASNTNGPYSISLNGLSTPVGGMDTTPGDADGSMYSYDYALDSLTAEFFGQTTSADHFLDSLPWPDDVPTWSMYWSSLLGDSATGT